MFGRIVVLVIAMVTSLAMLVAIGVSPASAEPNPLEVFIQQKQSALGTSVTGSATGPVYETSPKTGLNGVWREFEKGAIFYRSQTGATWVPNGPVLDAYLDFCGFFCYGFPTADLIHAKKGSVVLRTEFGGSFYSSPEIGVQRLWGPIYEKYSGLGGTTSALSLPESGIKDFGNTGAFFAEFQNGLIFSSQDGTYEIHGGIYAKWVALGGFGSSLGNPVSDVYKVSAGFRADFEHGSLIYSPKNHSTNTIYR